MKTRPNNLRIPKRNDELLNLILGNITDPKEFKYSFGDNIFFTRFKEHNLTTTRVHTKFDAFNYYAGTFFYKDYEVFRESNYILKKLEEYNVPYEDLEEDFEVLKYAYELLELDAIDTDNFKESKLKEIFLKSKKIKNTDDRKNIISTSLRLLYIDYTKNTTNKKTRIEEKIEEKIEKHLAINLTNNYFIKKSKIKEIIECCGGKFCFFDLSKKQNFKYFNMEYVKISTYVFYIYEDSTFDELESNEEVLYSFPSSFMNNQTKLLSEALKVDYSNARILFDSCSHF